MTSLLGKRLTKLGGGEPTRNPPRDEDFIRNLNYEELENKYQIRKYYPRFIHNYDYSTPQIKALIGHKPIYSKVNRANTKKEIVGFNAETGDFQAPADISAKLVKKLDKTKKREQRHERHKEYHELKREQRGLIDELREDRKSLRDQHRQERKEEREETRRLMREHSKRNAQKPSKQEPREGPKPEPARPEPARQNSNPPPYELSSQNTKTEGFSFKNPFDSGQTLVGTEPSLHSQVSHKNSVSTLERQIGRRSISEKFKKMVLHKRPEENKEPKQRTMSFDQTKSTMTSVRGAKNNLMRLNDKRGRGMSETHGTYF